MEQDIWQSSNRVKLLSLNQFHFLITMNAFFWRESAIEDLVVPLQTLVDVSKGELHGYQVNQH
jgi:hypothetical protein